MRKWLFAGVGLALSMGAGAFALAACAGWGSLCDNGACESPDGSGNNDAGDGGTTCDPKTQDCIDDTKGIFVDGTKGSDSAAGTRSAPVATIGKALALAKSQSKPNVYVCTGNYPENVDIKAPVDLLGGFSCADWTYATTNDATISPPSGLPLHIESTTASVSDLRFIAADGTSPGDSSLGALVASSTVTLMRDHIEAGKGANATQPAAQSDFTPAQAANGVQADAGAGGAQQVVTCSNGTGSSTGALGAPPGGLGGAKGQPYNTYTVNPTGADGTGGTSGASCAVGLGHDGSYGPGGDAGAGAAKLGSLDATGWHPVGGAAGGTGLVGQGGGGGASLDSSGGGGGGGVGGCGGAGGAPGAGGGGSVALALVSSTATLTQVTLAAKGAGNGAKGGTGQKAQLGGFYGQGFASGCGGGGGGAGGSGGGGGGGAGGVSVGVLWTGTPPTIDGNQTSAADTLASVTLGSPGAFGPGGDGGPAAKGSPVSNAGATGNPGPASAAKAVMQAP